MSSINSVGSSAYSGYAPATRSERPKPPDPGQMATDLFSKLDSSGDGSLDAGELQSMLDQLSSSGSTSGSSATDSLGASELMEKLDTDGDGSIGSGEFKQALEAGRPPPPPGDMPPMSTASFSRLGASSDDDNDDDQEASSRSADDAASGVATGTSQATGLNRFETSVLGALVSQRYAAAASSTVSWQQSLSLTA